ncbi:MAG TPA: nucleoside triphosphate pyrophosphohydrolase [Syntrophorhabdaceae bacterium]|nr:nucleoside triphosphate pyrophosphohydrolase [Syntrophorhabdaceae bacterium]
MESFDKLVDLMATLRSNEGCPWDRKQTVSAFKTFMLEEVYEIIEAIEHNDMANLKEELGDLLFHIVFIAQICKEHRAFDIIEVIDSVYRKMYNRHPHVFQKQPLDTPVEVKWEEIKKTEKDDYSLLANIPSAMPALLRAYVITKRAAKVGFDWEKVDDVYGKMHEEIGELKEAQASGDTAHIREEIGDLLFTIVNIARFLNVDPEDALRSTSDKFTRRFSYIENNTDIRNATLDTMDKLWNDSKSMENEEE